MYWRYLQRSSALQLAPSLPIPPLCSIDTSASWMHQAARIVTPCSLPRELANGEYEPTAEEIDKVR